MPGFNPNEARDKNGMWSKIAGLAISPEAKHQMVERLRQEEIAFAPYRSNQVDNLAQDELQRQSLEYQQYFTTGTFIQQGQYDEIIKEGGDKVRNKDGFDINNFIQKKREGYSKIALRKSRGS